MRFYFLDFQFLGPDSQTLGQGAWCANDQGIYYEYNAYVYSHQGQENSGWAAPDKLKVLVSNLSGLDVQRFNSCLDDKTYVSRVQQLTSLGQSLGETGTPTFFIGSNQTGYIMVVGALPFSALQQVIDGQLRKAH